MARAFCSAVAPVSPAALNPWIMLGNPADRKVARPAPLPTPGTGATTSPVNNPAEIPLAKPVARRGLATPRICCDAKPWSIVASKAGGGTVMGMVTTPAPATPAAWIVTRVAAPQNVSPRLTARAKVGVPTPMHPTAIRLLEMGTNSVGGVRGIRSTA